MYKLLLNVLSITWKKCILNNKQSLSAVNFKKNYRTVKYLSLLQKT